MLNSFAFSPQSCNIFSLPQLKLHVDTSSLCCCPYSRRFSYRKFPTEQHSFLEQSFFSFGPSHQHAWAWIGKGMSTISSSLHFLFKRNHREILCPFHSYFSGNIFPKKQPLLGVHRSQLPTEKEIIKEGVTSHCILGAASHTTDP